MPTLSEPEMAAIAPNTPTQAYTMEFTNRVHGLVMDEKNSARMPHTRSRSLISSNRASQVSSREKTFTTFCPPTVSSTSEVISPRVSDCAFEHAKRAPRHEIGHQQRNGRDQNDDQRDAHIQPEHEDERAHDGHRAGEQLREANEQAIGNLGPRPSPRG